MNTATKANLTLTDKAQAIMAVIARGATSRDEIATAMGVSVPVVNGSLTSLKRNGLIEMDDAGAITFTPDAKQFVKPSAKNATGTPRPRGPRPGSKMEQARQLFGRFVDNGRQAVLEQFRHIGLTPKGAATYYQTIRHETGAMAFQRGQAGKSPPAGKTAVRRGAKKK